MKVINVPTFPSTFGGSIYHRICCCGRHVRALYAVPRLRCRRCAGLGYVAATLHDPWKLNSHYCALVDAGDRRPGRKPKRYGGDSLNALIHGARAIHQYARAVARIGAGRAVRGWRRSH